MDRVLDARVPVSLTLQMEPSMSQTLPLALLFLIVACDESTSGGNAATQPATPTEEPVSTTDPFPVAEALDACAGQSTACVDVELLISAWAAIATPVAPPYQPIAIGDVNGDGHQDWRIGEWLTLGPATATRNLPAESVATIGWAALAAGDIDSDGIDDLQRQVDVIGRELLLGPFQGDVVSRTADSVRPAWFDGELAITPDRVDLLSKIDAASSDFMVTPGPLSNWTSGIGTLNITVEVVNADPRTCDWTTTDPRLVSAGDLDSDGDVEQVLFPFGGYEPWCGPSHVGYLVPSPLPSAAVLDDTGLAGWAVIKGIDAIADQSGDGIADARVLLEDGRHLVAGPVTSVGGVLSWTADLGIMPDEYALAKSVVDVTGDGIADWIVTRARGELTDVLLRAGGIDAMFSAEQVDLAWWSSEHAGAFAVDGSALLFPSRNGIVVVDLLN